MAITRRPVRHDEYEWARAAHHSAYRGVVERQFGTWDEERQDRFFSADWEGAEMAILEWDGVPCGYTAVEHRASDIHLRELVVHPDFQGRGIGTLIVQDAMKDAERRQVPVHLGTFLMNDALHLYHRLGFIEIDRDDTHVILRWQWGEARS